LQVSAEYDILRQCYIVPLLFKEGEDYSILASNLRIG
jgi:hypothetical protein